eukprot:m51a1_g10153 Transport protein particle (TRAPP) component Trs120 (1066) ;mRNA; r:8551-12220
MSGAARVSEGRKFSFLDERAVLVVVIPVGDIAQAKFSELAAHVVRAGSDVDLRNVTRMPPSQNKWNAGHMHYAYVTGPAATALAQRSDWDDFHSFKKVAVVVGIAHCPTFRSLRDAHTLFEAAAQTYGTARHRICLAFEPLPTQVDEPLDEIVMVPPSRDVHQLHMYIETHINDLTSQLISAFERNVFTSEGAKDPVICTPLDSNKTAEDVRVLMRKKPGRMAKIRGDWCLQSGQIRDAIFRYEKAAEEAKLQADTEWMAGAIEGHISALISFDVDERGNLNDREAEVVVRAEEALGLYGRRNAPVLEYELMLRVADFEASVGHRVEAAEWLSRAQAVADDEKRLGVQDRIALLSCIGAAYRAMRMPRKAAQALVQAAQLYRTTFEAPAAHALLCLAAPALGLCAAVPEGAPQDEGAGGRRGRGLLRGVPVAARGWRYAQMAVLNELVATAKQAGDYAAAARCASYMLRQFHAAMPLLDQSRLSVELLGCAARLSAPVDLSGRALALPVLLEAAPVKLAGPRAPVSLDAKATGPFLYTPLHLLAKQAAHDYRGWVACEPCELALALANPLDFEVPLDAVGLVASGPSGAPAVSSRPAVVPARCARHVVRVAVRPAAGGVLRVHGVVLQSLGVVHYHPLAPSGRALSPEEFAAPRGGAGEGDEPARLAVTVTEALPLVELRLPCAGAGAQVQLLEGEERLCRVELLCTSPSGLPAGLVELALSAASETGAALAPAACCWLEGWDPAAALPLLPGRRCCVGLGVRGVAGLRSVTLTARVARGPGAAVGRVASVAVAARVRPGLSVAACDVWPERAQPSMRPTGRCVAALALCNPLPASLAVSCALPSPLGPAAPRAEVSVEAHCSHELLVCLPRAPAPDAGADHKWAGERLAELVQVAWKTSTGRRGTVRLPALGEQPNKARAGAIAEALAAPRVALSASLLGDGGEDASAGAVRVLSPVRVRATARVARPQQEGPVSLEVLACVSLENGVVAPVPAGRMLCAGAAHARSDSSSGGSGGEGGSEGAVAVELAVRFLAAGSYCFSVVCRSVADGAALATQTLGVVVVQ